jgi:FAD/FMN-containing dehydrogenase
LQAAVDEVGRQGMTSTLSGGTDALRAALTGPVLVPGDAGYDETRATWNGDIDRRPAAIAEVADDADVVAALRFARAAGLDLTVRGGGHNSSGTSVAEGALMIDLGALDSVVVDPDARTARVGGGATLGLLDAAATAHGLATPVGTLSDTGVGGLTLGGGMGWLSRKFGLAIDNLLSVRVVTADGEILRAAADENPDLFWAVRGGGGNFGVVTEFEFRLHRVDPMVQMGMFFFPLDRIADVLRLTRDLTEDLDQDLNVIVGGVNAPPAPFVPEAWQGAPGMAIVLVGFDGTPAHAEVARRIRAAVTPVFELVTPMPYAALQQLFDEGNTWGQLCYEKGTYIDDFSDGVIEVLADMVPRKVSPLSQLLFMRLDGRFCEIDEDATAFGGTRTPRFMAFLLGMVPAGADLSGEREYIRGLFTALQPYAEGRGTYVNALSPDEPDRIRASYSAPKYARLAEVKAAYDPGNVFHHNTNIPPAT